MTMNEPDLNARSYALGELLVNNGFHANDPLTATALASVLVSCCVFNGVKKKEFFGILHDIWRRAIIVRDHQLTVPVVRPTLEEATAGVSAEAKELDYGNAEGLGAESLSQAQTDTK